MAGCIGCSHHSHTPTSAKRKHVSSLHLTRFVKKAFPGSPVSCHNQVPRPKPDIGQGNKHILPGLEACLRPWEEGPRWWLQLPPSSSGVACGWDSPGGVASLSSELKATALLCSAPAKRVGRWHAFSEGGQRAHSDSVLCLVLCSPVEFPPVWSSISSCLRKCDAKIPLDCPELPTCWSHTFVQKVHSLSYSGLISISAERVVSALHDYFWPGEH